MRCSQFDPQARYYHKWMLLLGGVVALLVLAALAAESQVMAEVSPMMSAPAPAGVPPSANSVAPSRPADCPPDWSVVSSPPSASLNAIAAVSSSDAWAVGDDSLALHWDGSAWSKVPTPNVGIAVNFYGVAAISSNDVWAVGYYQSDYPNVNKTLAEHWNGNAWSVVPSPNPPSDENFFNGVAAVSSSDVWVVGYYGVPNGAWQTLVEHWNGNAWSIVPSPNVGSGYNYLYGVAAVSSNDMWSVGDAGNDGTLIEHWNGSAWSVVPSPNLGNSNGLTGVAAVSSSDVWAVGVYNISNANANQTLVEHWNGTAWSVVPSPNRGVNNYLRGVAAISSSDLWAVGDSQYTISNTSQTLVEHWDGSAWSVVTSSSPSTTFNNLNAIAAVSNSDAWAVGYYYDGSGGAVSLVERYDPLPCPPTPTPTPLVPPPCPGERFTDVCPTDYFYPYVQALTTNGILSGYNTAPPCPNSLWIPCFRPYNSSTRAQISKVVSLAAGFNEVISDQTFQDVPPGSAFYAYIGRMAAHGVISGYPCGGNNEPCVPPANLPYFRPNNSVTRGQLSKMTSLAFGWDEPISGQQFQDVPVGSTFYNYIGRLVNRGIISGYLCGGAGEPCVPPANLPYFRPNNNVTRGQTAKIVQLARTQPTNTPTPTPTFTSTPTSTPPPTYTSTPTLTVVPTATTLRGGHS